MLKLLMHFRAHFTKQLTFGTFCISSPLPVSKFMGFLYTLLSLASPGTASRPDLAPTYGMGTEGLKRPRREAGSSRPSSVEDKKMVGLSLHSIGRYGVMLNYIQGKIYLVFGFTDFIHFPLRFPSSLSTVFQFLKCSERSGIDMEKQFTNTRSGLVIDTGSGIL
jgi:hypothetical protein